MTSRSTIWRRNNPEKSNAIRKRAYLKIRGTASKATLDLTRERNRAYLRSLRDAAMNAYGGWRCVCCGELEKLFLSIDHKENDGADHRRKVGSTAAFLLWLKRNKYPQGFQVLCMNCNMGRYRNGGICPHERAGLERPPEGA